MEARSLRRPSADVLLRHRWRPKWIHPATRRAIPFAAWSGVDVRVVHVGGLTPALVGFKLDITPHGTHTYNM
jgi:hypothetical protein